MNRLEQISKYPTTFPGPRRSSSATGFQSCHESLLRSYQILELVKDWVKNGASGDVLLDTIEYLQSCPNTEFELP